MQYGFRYGNWSLNKQKRIILHMLEELSGFFKTLVKLQPVLKLEDHNPAHRKYIQGNHVLES